MNIQTADSGCILNETELRDIERLRRGESEQASYFAEQREHLRQLTQARLSEQLNRRLDASDVLQDTFITYSKRIDSYLKDPKVPPLVWLRTLTRQVIFGTTGLICKHNVVMFGENSTLRIHRTLMSIFSPPP